MNYTKKKRVICWKTITESYLISDKKTLRTNRIWCIKQYCLPNHIALWGSDSVRVPLANASPFSILCPHMCVCVVVCMWEVLVRRCRAIPYNWRCLFHSWFIIYWKSSRDTKRKESATANGFFFSCFVPLLRHIRQKKKIIYHGIFTADTWPI